MNTIQEALIAGAHPKPTCVIRCKSEEGITISLISESCSMWSHRKQNYINNNDIISLFRSSTRGRSDSERNRHIYLQISNNWRGNTLLSLASRVFNKIIDEKPWMSTCDKNKLAFDQDSHVQTTFLNNFWTQRRWPSSG